MISVAIDAADRTPIYAQLERALRAAIAVGRLRAGDQLPTVRQLAVDLRINANTVARVYGELERAGVIETRRGIGSFVTASRAAARPAEEKARRLQAFATRVLADAGRQGFTADEVIAALARERGAANAKPVGSAEHARTQADPNEPENGER